jgi:hypothetical protein
VLLLRDVSVVCLGEPQVLAVLPRTVAHVWGPDCPDPRTAGAYNPALSQLASMAAWGNAGGGGAGDKGKG